MFLILTKHWNPKHEYGSKMFKGIKTVKFQSLDSNIKFKPRRTLRQLEPMICWCQPIKTYESFLCDNLLKVGVELKMVTSVETTCMYVDIFTPLWHYGDVWNSKTSPFFWVGRLSPLNSMIFLLYMTSLPKNGLLAVISRFAIIVIIPVTNL